MDGIDARNVSGPHVGRGPRGYQRSDARIRDDVCEALSRDPRIDAEGILVLVTAGEVMLTGSVREKEDRWLAEDVASECPGVRDVVTDLQVIRAPGEPIERDDR